MAFETKKAAEARAKEVRARMRTPKKWNIEVHHNMGWHWKLTCQNVSLHESSYDSGRFWTLISDDPRYANYGVPAWTDTRKDYKNPQAAVDGGVKVMLKVIVQTMKEYRECMEAGKQAII